MNEEARKLDEQARIESLERTRDTWMRLGRDHDDAFYTDEAQELDREIQALKEAQERARQGKK